MGPGIHHHHHHDHDHEHSDALAPVLDVSIPDKELSPGDVSRRRFLRGAGVLGVAGAAEPDLGASPQVSRVA